MLQIFFFPIPFFFFLLSVLTRGPHTKQEKKLSENPGILLWDFFVQVEFDVWLISSTIELSFRPIVHFVVEIPCFAIVPHPQ